jgi:hypothetical protein
MSFDRISLPLFLAGLAALVGALFLLQRIRVRHRRVDVPTTLFWRAAAQETRARVLVKRFRHPYAFALMALLSAFLWIGYAGLTMGKEKQPVQLLLIDGSAATTLAEDVEALRAAAVDWAKSSGTRDRRVVWCGAHPRTLLRSGEDWALLKERLRDQEPEAAPSTLIETLESELLISSDKELRIDVLTRSDLDLSSLAKVSDRARIARLPLPSDRPLRRAQITAFGLADARSLDYEAVDAYISIDGSADAGIRCTLNGVLLSPEIDGTNPESRSIFWLRDLPTSGGLLRVALLPEDQRSPERVAERVLPHRKRIPVAVDSALAPLLAPLIEADPALRLTDESDALVLIGRGFRSDTDLSQLCTVDRADQEDTFLIHTSDNREANVVLEASMRALGLEALDAPRLAQELGTTISLGVTESSRRHLTLWQDILDAGHEFRSSRVFPVFFALSIRWLAGAQPVIPVLRAGFPAAEVETIGELSASPKADRVLAARFAGPQIATRNPASAVPMLPTGPTCTIQPSTPPLAAEPPVNRVTDLGYWLSAAALILLTIEWFLFRSGKIP